MPMDFRRKEFEISFLAPNMNRSVEFAGQSDFLSKRMTSKSRDLSTRSDVNVPRSVNSCCTAEGQLQIFFPRHGHTYIELVN